MQEAICGLITSVACTLFSLGTTCCTTCCTTCSSHPFWHICTSVHCQGQRATLFAQRLDWSQAWQVFKIWWGVHAHTGYKADSSMPQFGTSGTDCCQVLSCLNAASLACIGQATAPAVKSHPQVFLLDHVGSVFLPLCFCSSACRRSAGSHGLLPNNLEQQNTQGVTRKWLSLPCDHTIWNMVSGTAGNFYCGFSCGEALHSKGQERRLQEVQASNGFAAKISLPTLHLKAMLPREKAHPPTYHVAAWKGTPPHIMLPREKAHPHISCCRVKRHTPTYHVAAWKGTHPHIWMAIPWTAQ